MRRRPGLDRDRGRCFGWKRRIWFPSGPWRIREMFLLVNQGLAVEELGIISCGRSETRVPIFGGVLGNRR